MFVMVIRLVPFVLLTMLLNQFIIAVSKVKAHAVKQTCCNVKTTLQRGDFRLRRGKNTFILTMLAVMIILVVIIMISEFVVMIVAFVIVAFMIVVVLVAMLIGMHRDAVDTFLLCIRQPYITPIAGLGKTHLMRFALSIRIGQS